MTADLSPFTVYPGGQTSRGDGAPPGGEFQELWFSMARLPWASLVIVPVDPGASAASVATALADVGTRLRDAPVTAIVANRMDYGSARTLADLQPRLRGDRLALPSVEVEARPVDPAAPPSNGSSHMAAPVPPIGRAIIAIQPVVDEPLGIAVAQAADAVVLCIEIGKTRLPAARRTIDLIGADRVIGAVLVR